MKNSSSSQSKIGSVAFGGLVLVAWAIGIFLAPTEINQGEVYRLIYLHVPSAFSAFSMSFVLAGLGLACLVKHSKKKEAWLYACGEVGLVFTLITLASGSIWGRPTWGVWWTWDARLTTTLILALLYGGFIILTQSFDDREMRVRAASFLSIFIALNVPIIYKSVTWWRTLHQPPTLLSSAGPTISSSILWVLLLNLFALIGFALWLGHLRAKFHMHKLKLEEIVLH